MIIFVVITNIDPYFVIHIGQYYLVDQCSYFDSISADLGQAIYVVDETNSDACLNTYPNNECFL